MMDRTLGTLGRIQKSYGTDDPDTIAGMKVMVTTLYKSGEWSFLEALRDNKITLLQLWAKYKKQDIKSMTSVEGITPFDPTVFEWLNAYPDIKDKTKESYEHAYRQLLKIKASFTVADIPIVLKKYREQCAKKGINRQFNITRNALRSFLKNHFDQFNPIYQGVVMVKPLNDKPKRVEKAWSVQDIVKVTSKLSAPIAAQVWTACQTGAGITEYENGLVVEGDGIRIRGTKMARVDDRRNRVVPFVETPAPLVVRVKRFRGHLKKASNDDMQPYDLRRTYANWCLEAGIPFDRVQQYLGHQPKSITERYARSTVMKWLKDDGELLRKWIEKQKTLKVNKMASKFFGP